MHAFLTSHKKVALVC